ncbi:hypothetical protein, partial [Sporisorium scitamineum]
MHTPTLDLPHFDVPLLQYLVQAAFPDRALCIETLERFAHDHGFQISIRTSKGPITYLCCRKGRHIAMSRNPPASVSSYLSFTNCPYSLKLIQQSESRFVLNIVKSHHNHAPFPYGFEPPKPNTNTNTNTNTSTTSIAAAAAGDGGSNKRPRSGSEWLAWESCSTPRDDEHDLGDARPVSKQMFPADGRHIRAHSPAGSSASMVTNATARPPVLSSQPLPPFLPASRSSEHLRIKQALEQSIKEAKSASTQQVQAAPLSSTTTQPRSPVPEIPSSSPPSLPSENLAALALGSPVVASSPPPSQSQSHSPTQHSPPQHQSTMSVNHSESVGYFSGSANGVNGTNGSKSPRHFAKSFNRYLVHTNEQDDAKAAKLFGYFLEGPAETWFEDLPAATCGSWSLLEKAFLDRFEVNSAGVK